MRNASIFTALVSQEFPMSSAWRKERCCTFWEMDVLQNIHEHDWCRQAVKLGVLLLPIRVRIMRSLLLKTLFIFGLWSAHLVMGNDTEFHENSHRISSALIQCGEYSNQALSNGKCRITATLPQLDEQRCPDMFRCTDEVSYWLHENEERKQQILDLKETISELQEELRNHRHRIKVLELQVFTRWLLSALRCRQAVKLGVLLLPIRVRIMRSLLLKTLFIFGLWSAHLVMGNDTEFHENSHRISSALIQCGEYSNQALSNGKCRITATLPQLDEQRCPDMFRCTDEVSYWLHENEERKQQILDLKETISELQEELRNHRHRIKVLELQQMLTSSFVTSGATTGAGRVSSTAGVIG
ncbi:UNVERIFIED_CONTAM: hypothetical protein FKN15_066254 [Acipenser sinensis]